MPTSNNPNRVPETLGERVAEIRRLARAGSQAKFGEAIGLKQPSVWDIENGKTLELMAETVQCIHEAYGANWSYIMRGQGLRFVVDMESEREEQLLVAMFRDLREPFRGLLLAMARQIHERAADGSAATRGQPRLPRLDG